MGGRVARGGKASSHLTAAALLLIGTGCRYYLH